MAIEKALAFNSTSAAAKNIMTERLENPLLTVLADPQMVETVLRNLIGNAVSFAERDGTVSSEARRDEGEVVITIRDNGVGIPSKRLVHLFNFESGASIVGTEGEKKGTGQGLQLCKELIELQGGVLSVESTVGQGSTFRFTLPSAI